MSESTPKGKPGRPKNPDAWARQSQIRFAPELLDAIEKYRVRESLPTKSEAIRRLVVSALRSEGLHI